LCEMSPTLTFQEVLMRELHAAGVEARPLAPGAA